jgi:putative ABC transport system permease protein
MYYPYIIKELRHRHNRTLVNILGISVGITLFISINALSSAYKKAAEQPFKDMGADLIVQRAQKQQSGPGSQAKSMRGIKLPFSNQLFSPQDLTILKNLEDISESAQALLLWEFTKTGFSSILGVDLQQPALGGLKVKNWIYKGRFPEKKGEIALEKHFAKFKKIKPGSSFMISGQTFDVVGTIEIKEGAQVSAANIYMLIDNARDLLGEGSAGAVNLVYLGLKNLSRQNQIKSQISSKIKGASINSSDSFLELMGGVSMISDKFSLIASMVGLIGAALLIIKTMISNLVERSYDIGILKAMGWTRKDIQKQLMVETFIQAVAGGFLGIMMGYLISFCLGFLSISIPVPWEMGFVPSMAKQTQALNQIVRLPISVSLSLTATAMSLSVIIGCITGYILGKRTEKMKPADIFRQL